MNKKIFITILMFSLLIITTCSYCFAAPNIKNDVMKAENAVGNVAVTAKNAVVNGTTEIVNGAKNLGKDAVNTTGIIGNDVKNTATSTTGMVTNMGNTNYTATRTSNNNSNLFGLSSAAWTWLILGIVGVVIVGLVWYYGSQYEHRNFSDGE